MSSNENGIQLVSEDEITEVELRNESFVSRRKLIPALGSVLLFGDRSGIDFADSDLGLTIQRSRTLLGQARNFEAQGLYCVSVFIYGAAQPKTEFYCRVILPDSNSLTSELVFDEDTLQRDPLERYKLFTGPIWRAPNGKQVYFFMPPYSQELSLPRFRFYY